jgi:hypothetical protein
MVGAGLGGHRRTEPAHGPRTAGPGSVAWLAPQSSSSGGRSALSSSSGWASSARLDHGRQPVRGRRAGGGDQRRPAGRWHAPGRARRTRRSARRHHVRPPTPCSGPPPARAAWSASRARPPPLEARWRRARRAAPRRDGRTLPRIGRQPSVNRERLEHRLQLPAGLAQLLLGIRARRRCRRRRTGSPERPRRAAQRSATQTSPPASSSQPTPPVYQPRSPRRGDAASRAPAARGAPPTAGVGCMRSSSSNTPTSAFTRPCTWLARCCTLGRRSSEGACEATSAVHSGSSAPRISRTTTACSASSLGSPSSVPPSSWSASSQVARGAEPASASATTRPCSRPSRRSGEAPTRLTPGRRTANTAPNRDSAPRARSRIRGPPRAPGEFEVHPARQHQLLQRQALDLGERMAHSRGPLRILAGSSDRPAGVRVHGEGFGRAAATSSRAMSGSTPPAGNRHLRRRRR